MCYVSIPVAYFPHIPPWGALNLTKSKQMVEYVIMQTVSSGWWITTWPLLVIHALKYTHKLNYSWYIMIGTRRIFAKTHWQLILLAIWYCRILFEKWMTRRTIMNYIRWSSNIDLLVRCIPTCRPVLSEVKTIQYFSPSRYE